MRVDSRLVIGAQTWLVIGGTRSAPAALIGETVILVQAHHFPPCRAKRLFALYNSEESGSSVRCLLVLRL